MVAAEGTAATGPTVRMGQWVLLVHSSAGHVTANVSGDVAREVRLVRCRVWRPFWLSGERLSWTEPFLCFLHVSDIALNQSH